MRDTLATALAATALAVLVGVGVLFDALAPARVPPPPGPAAARAPDSGAWYCAVGEMTAESGLTVLAAVPETAATSAAVRLDAQQAGTVQRGPEVEAFPGTAHVRRAVGEGGAVGFAGRWWRAPAVVSRVWERRTGGEPRGLVEGHCEPHPSAAWYLAGVTTAGGAQAWIVVANPFDTDASLTVTLATPEGPLEPELLRNIVVPTRSIRSILLNEHAPERSDLGAIVRVRSGRVVAEGWQSADPVAGGVSGVTLLKLAADARITWTVPWYRDDLAAAGWLWVSNPTDRPASVAVTLHTVEGGLPPEGLEEVTVPPGGVRRVELGGLLPEGHPAAAVTATSQNDVPIVVSASTEVYDETPERTGFAVLLGAPAADRAWVVPGGRTHGRSLRLHLVNPSAEGVTAGVTLWTPGRTDVPVELGGLFVPAGAVRAVDLGPYLPDADHHVAYVRADGGLVVAVEGFDLAGDLALVAQVGVPSSVWSGGHLVPPLRHDPALTRRLGTVRDPRPPAVGPTPAPQAPPPEEFETPPAPPAPPQRPPEPPDEDPPGEDLPGEDPLGEGPPGEGARS